MLVRDNNCAGNWTRYNFTLLMKVNISTNFPGNPFHWMSEKCDLLVALDESERIVRNHVLSTSVLNLKEIRSVVGDISVCFMD